MRNLSCKWWLEKAVLPGIFVLVAATASWFLGPAILHRNDERRAEQAMRFGLVEDVGSETADMMNAMWRYERALNTTFERVHRLQSIGFRDRMRATCGHLIAAPEGPPKLDVSGDQWTSAVLNGYYDRFRQHQLWAVREKIRIAFLFPNNADIQSSFLLVEEGVRMSHERLKQRQSAFDEYLAARETGFAALLAEVRSKKITHDLAHNDDRLHGRSQDIAALIEKQPVTLLHRTETAQQQLFAYFQDEDITRPLAMSLVQRQGVSPR